MNGNPLIVCPTADAIGCYVYFEYHAESEPYLAGVLADTGTEKQYIRFARVAK